MQVKIIKNTILKKVIYFSPLLTTIVVQRDYVDSGILSNIKRKKINQSKRSAFGIFVTRLAFAVAIIVMSVFYFIAYNKSEKTVITPNIVKQTRNTLPPKPEERWLYIKELENRNIGIPMPTEPSIGKGMNSTVQVNSKQHLLMEREDISKDIIHLDIVPYNNNNTSRCPIASATQQCMNSQERDTTFKQQQVQSNVKIRRNAAKQELKEQASHWLVQCGSFKEMDQAESVRALLAFAGFEGHVVTGGGWNRVLLGPYSSRTGANKILQSIHVTGVSNCISIATKG